MTNVSSLTHAISINPATGALITQMACGGAEDIDRAVASAKRAWDDRRWRDLTPRTRMDIFRRWADLVERDAADLQLPSELADLTPINGALDRFVDAHQQLALATREWCSAWPEAGCTL